VRLEGRCSFRPLYLVRRALGALRRSGDYGRPV